MLATCVDFVEKKRKTGFKNLEEWLQKGEIDKETYHELQLINERMAKIMLSTFINGNNLIKKGVVDNFSQLLEFRNKPLNDEEAFITLRKMVIEGSENPSVRKLAVDIAEKTSAITKIGVPVPPVEKLYSEFLGEQDETSILAFLNHCSNVSREIYSYVRNKFVYVSDPPDDFFQTPLHTMEILNYRGDCDDLAILICSLYRSIGFHTFMGFQSGHIFAGVILPQIRKIGMNVDSQSSTLFNYVEIPADPQAEDFEILLGSSKTMFSIFDLMNTTFEDYLSQTTPKIAELLKNEEKTATSFRAIADRLFHMSEAKIFHIDPGNFATINSFEGFKNVLEI